MIGDHYMAKKSIFSLSAIAVIILLVETAFAHVPHTHAQSTQNWSEPINLSMSGAASNPAMVVDTQGTLHVLWIDRFDGYKYVQSTDGSSWSSPLSVNYPFSLVQSRPPVFLAGPDQVIHILWLGERHELFYARALGETLDTPAAWQARAQLDSFVLDFDVRMDEQGGIHLAYIKNPIAFADASGRLPAIAASSATGIFYRRWTTAANSWNSASLLYDSPYLRSLTTDTAHIGIAASRMLDGDHVYVVWDNQAEKRILWATSIDGGVSWEPARNLITPQASWGYSAPYHGEIDILKDQILVRWQVGEPGVQCTSYSWASSDGGKSWDEPVKIMSEIAGCPQQSMFVSLDPDYSVTLFTFQDNLAISAWNGIQWSFPEIQSGPSSVTNPTTLDVITLGCEQIASFADQLFVVGCDQGPGGDIWFMSRKLEPLDTLFPSPTAWSRDTAVAESGQIISSLSSISDDIGNLHALWIQSPSQPAGPADQRIVYARWDGEEWTQPAPVIADLAGPPLNLTLQVDSQQRLLLSWINQLTGQLLFSWANAERADIPVEWTTPVAIASPSQSTNSPDMLVDSLDRILIAYAINVNEDRGIYLIQSDDTGVTWSEPVRVFDAAAANWEMVDEPRLAVTEDGALHILFAQYTLLGGKQAVGLYFSQSRDGGITWTEPLRINQKPTIWSEVAAYKGTLHRFWQEYDRARILTYHQVSLDSGLTWSTSTTLPSEVDVVSAPAIALDPGGTVHLLQIVWDDRYVLQEWDWSNERSQLIEAIKLGIDKDSDDLRIVGAITSQNDLFALIQSRMPASMEAAKTSLLSTQRSLEIEEAVEPFLAAVSTPFPRSIPTQEPEIQPESTRGAPTIPMDDTGSRTIEDIVGLIVILSMVGLAIFLIIPKRNRPATKAK